MDDLSDTQIEERFSFNTKKEEAQYYGLNGCLCIQCVNKRILKELERSINQEDTETLTKFFSETKKIIDITDIAKKRYNIDVHNEMCRCPFHEDKTPSLKFYPHTSSYFCFGCGATGDTIDFIDRMETKQKIKPDTSRLIITPVQRYKILDRQKWKCNRCGEKLRYSKNHNTTNSTAHIDHIHPYSKRNSYINGQNNINEQANLQALCERCNIRKNNASS